MSNTGNTQQIIDYGATANDGTGDPLRTAFIKTDENFSNIWAAGPVGSNITIANNTIQNDSTNGNITLKPNGTGVIQANASILPNIDSVRDLGSNTRAWRRAYINIANISEITVQSTLDVAGDATIQGNLTVEGDTIQIGNITTDTLLIQLANAAANSAQANGAGVTVGANDDIATILYNSSGNVWTTNIGISAGGNVTAPYFLGNGSQLTGINQYGNSNVAAYLPTYTGNLAGSRLAVTSGSNTWVIANDRITSPDGGMWRSDTINNDEYITSSPDGYINLQSVYANANVASEIHLEHGLVNIRTINGGTKEWDFDEAGNTTFPGNILPGANGVYSLGNSTNYWANLWVANNTIYIGGVPLGMTAGNVLTVAGEPVLTNDSDTSITTTGNITANVITATGAINVGDMSIGELPGYITADANIGMVVNVSGPDGGFVVDYLKEDGNANTSQGELAFSSETGNATYRISLTDDAGDGFATKIWRFDGTGNLTLPSGGNIIGAGNVNFNNGSRVQTATNNINLQANVNGAVELKSHGGNYIWGFDNYGWMTLPEADAAYTPVANGSVLFAPTAMTFKAGLANLIFDYTGNLTLPSEGNIVGITPNNAGRIQWVGNSSGDGSGYTTLRLVPDDTLEGDDQYLIIDPTGPGHIHIRAGGTQDDSGADLILGGENSHVKVTAGANPPVYVSANNQSWTFTTDGVFQTPGDISVNGNVTANYFIGNGSQLTGLPAPTVSQDITSNGAMSIMLYDGTIKYNNYATVEPSSGNIAGGNISTTGNVTANYFIGDGSQLTGLPASYGNANVVANLAALSSNPISTTGNITAGNFIGSGSDVELVAQTEQWVFDTTGVLTLPGEGVLRSVGDSVTLQSYNAGTGNANSVYLGSGGGLGFFDQAIGGNWLEIFRSGAEPQIRVPVGRGNLNVQTAEGINAYDWVFDNTGNLTAPGNITGNTGGFAIGYRDIPQVSFTGDATLAATDAGKHYYSTLATANTLTIANNGTVSWPVGTAITVVNRGTGNITIAQAASVSLYLAGNSTAGNRTVTTYGMATLLHVAANVWMINGTGVV